MKLGLVALCCAAAVSIGVAFSVTPASAQNRLKTCNDEWNAMKANNTVGDKKYADDMECVRVARVAVAAIAFSPSSILWSTQPLKDVLFLFLFALFVMACGQGVLEVAANP